MRLQRQNSGNLEQKTKGNQELQLKADELEVLFAAHQLRVSRRTSTVDVPEKEEVELNPNMNIVELGRLNNSKGRLYNLYTQKRESKLRQEWDLRRVQNEEKMKAMNDSLDRIRAVMIASSGQRPEKKIIQQPIKHIQIQDDCISETLSGDDSSSSKNSKPKKFGHSRTFSSTLPRSAAQPPPIPRSASKGSNIGRRRVVPENPVPNFSEFREENTKQSQRKDTSRLQFSHVPRSKSINGHTHAPPTAKKDNPLRSQSMKKSLSPPKPNGVNVARESRPFLKKGNGIGPGAGAGIAKMKATMEAENTSSEEEEEEEEEETKIMPIPADSDSEIDSSRLKQESESEMSHSIPRVDDIVMLKSNPQVESDLVSEVTTVPASTFQTPEQSPASWSSRMQSPFSLKSPMASPRSTINLESESPKTRKKWGVAQTPFVMGNAGSDNQSSSNVAKGFKRLLNFGRKSRATEGLADGISSTTSTTSEGDDDTRMGFSPAHSSYEAFNDEVQNLRSSIPRTPENYKLKDHNLSGSSLTAPKSFFSLASFRKGSDLKPR